MNITEKAMENYKKLFPEVGKEAVSLSEGDVVVIPANVKHRHGAKKDS